MSQAEVILERLLQTGKITEADLVPLVVDDQDLVQTIELVHLSFCPFEHEHDCSYYFEKQKDERWTLPAHNYWAIVTRKMLAELSLTCLEYRDSYYKATKIIKQESEEVLAILGLLLTKGNGLWDLIDQEPEPHAVPFSLHDGAPSEQLEQ